MQHASLEYLGVRRSIEEWGIFRDAEAWDALDGLFHPQGKIRVAWYEGYYKKFIELSRAGAGKSFAKHIICNSSIQLRETHAVAETNVILIGRGSIRGIICHGETHMRFLDCFQRSQAGRWQILDRSAVYDHDLLASVHPDDRLELPDSFAAGWPIEYRYLAMRLSARGMTVASDLPTKGSEAEKHLRVRCAEWLAQASA